MEMSRIVHCEDAITWLNSNPILTGSSLVASIPDFSEFPKLTLEEWKKWFFDTATLVMSKCPDDGVSIFYQTDKKVDGIWIDKGFICQKAAELLGFNLLWHKIICRAPAGTPIFGMPSYTRILCFSKNLRCDISKSSADVIPAMGKKTWARGMGFEATNMIAKFIATQTNSKTIIHPFCGEGSMLATANSYGLKAIGIEKSPKRAEKSRRLKISKGFDGWGFENLEPKHFP